MRRVSELDIKLIETVVNRILRDKEENDATKSNEGVPYAKMKKNVPDVDEISYDDQGGSIYFLHKMAERSMSGLRAAL